ncbi:MAG: hypothetical protein ACE5KO_07405, partial [Candidatus Bathyarchaeia archaeon]
VSTRTVMRKTQRLVESNALILDPIVDLKKIIGIPCQLVLFCPDAKKKRAVDGQLLSRLKVVFVLLELKQHSMIGLYYHNITEAEESYRWVTKLDGVETARMYLTQEQIPVHEWLNDQIQRQF